MAIRMSNNVIGALNVVALLLSVPVLAAGVWLRSRADGTGCDHFLSTPTVALGAALAAVSLAGLAGACCRATWLVWLYLLAMLALAAALLCFTAFALAVTSRGAGDGGWHDSAWLRRHVEGSRSWSRVRSCLADAGVCKRLEKEGGKGKEEEAAALARLAGRGVSPVESGCCRPPASCNFTYAGSGEWTRPVGRGPAPPADPDCARWDNDGDKLCYGCQSCKASVEVELRRDWKRAAVFNAVFLAFIVVVCALSCCAFRNSRKDNFAYHSSRGGWNRAGDA
ncbi:tetraspanin-8-like [Panicum virgatum]|uniref:Tetraspanin-8 n=1 Tax=Panicum virgatum TaxID=38727 RepID=A0A8T0R0S5_PANVG|nr:tetraspanin-8-like [Panicum virgatum]KAG2579104.1 hypothetical protein PVAP13_6NG236606 [Panicum virgatum]